MNVLGLISRVIGIETLRLTVKIQGQCKSIVAIKIEEYEFGANRYVQSKNPYFIRSLNPIKVV
jgi:hypothetical protein